MRLLYATSITLPSYRANRIQITSMARAWTKLLGKDFVLGVGSIDETSSEGVNHIVMGEGVRSYKLAWKYLRYIQVNKFTTVYCREEKMLLFMVAYNKLFFRMPLRFCYELHHLVYMNVWWHKILLRQMDCVVSITNAMKDTLIKYGYPQERILVAPDAADMALFATTLNKHDARVQLGLLLDKKIVIYTGAINEAWKGVGTLYEAAKQFDDSYLFLIVGGKPHYVENFRAEHPELSNLSLLGYKPHTEIPLYLKSADVAVLPNSSKSEISRVSTSPMKLFEYMTSGVPIVASNLPSIREILNEKNATLVTPDDTGSLADGIRTVIQNPDLGTTLANQARSDVASHTWEKRATAILSFLQEV